MAKWVNLRGEAPLQAGSGLRYAIRYWWVIAGCAVLALGAAFLFLRIKSPAYRVNAALALNQEEGDGGGRLNGGLGALLSTFSLGGGGARMPDDEVFRLTSQTVLAETAKRTGIYFNAWSKPGLLSRKIWYYGDAPFKIELPAQMLDTLRTTTKFHLTRSGSGGEWKLSVKQRRRTVLDTAFARLPLLARTPVGMFRIDTTSNYKPSAKEVNFYATLTGPSVVADDLREDLDIGTVSKKSNIIWLIYDDARPDRAKAILNTLLEVYNEKTLDTQHEEAARSLDFIDRRLITLYSDLDASETRLRDYKTANNIIDPDAEAEFVFKQKMTAEEARLESEAKVGIIRLILEFISKPENRYAVVPFTMDMPDEPLKVYNELVMKRMRVASETKGNTRTLQLLSEQVDAMRSTMESTLRTHLEAAEKTLADVRRISASADRRISSAPEMEKQLRSLMRDQMVKNQIYGYLLQKREEAEVKLARVAPTGQIVDEAYEEVKPASPKKPLVIIGFFLAGVIGGYGIVYIMRLRGVGLDKKDGDGNIG